MAAACTLEPTEMLRCESVDTQGCNAGRGPGIRTCTADRTWSACVGPESCVRDTTRPCACDGGTGLQTCHSPSPYDRGTWGECDCFTRPTRVDASDCACESGCCQGRACASGNHAESCAPEGQACRACGEEQACVRRRCVPAPAGTFSLVVLTATLPALDPSGRGCPTWDCDSTPYSNPDPFVVSTFQAIRTVTVADTISPAWSEVVASGLTREQLEHTFLVSVVDDDGGDSGFDEDDPIVSFAVAFPPETFGAGPVRFQASNGSSLTMEIR